MCTLGHEINNHRTIDVIFPQVISIAPTLREGTHAKPRHPRQTSVVHTPQGSTDTFASRLPALRPDWRLELCSFSRLLHATGNGRLRAVSLSSFCRDLICLKQLNVISATRQAPRRRTCQFFVSSCISVRLPDLIILGRTEAKKKQRRKCEGWRKPARNRSHKKTLGFQKAGNQTLHVWPPRAGKEQTTFRATSSEVSRPAQETKQQPRTPLKLFRFGLTSPGAAAPWSCSERNAVREPPERHQTSNNVLTTQIDCPVPRT